MTQDVLVVVLVAVGLTVLGAGIVLYRLGRRVRRSLEEASAVSRRLEPRLERFQQDSAVRARELHRLTSPPEGTGPRGRDRSV